MGVNRTLAMKLDARALAVLDAVLASQWPSEVKLGYQQQIDAVRSYIGSRSGTDDAAIGWVAALEQKVTGTAAPSVAAAPPKPAAPRPDVHARLPVAAPPVVAQAAPVLGFGAWWAARSTPEKALYGAGAVGLAWLAWRTFNPSKRASR